MMNGKQMQHWLNWRKQLGLPPVPQDKLNAMLRSEDIIEDRPALPAQRIHWREISILWGLIVIRKRLK